jgi:predicted peptidase
MRPIALVAGSFIALCALWAMTDRALADTVEKSGTFGGMTVHYKVVVPPGYDPTRAYPTVLAFPPGGQDMRIVDGSLARNYRTEAERRGYIVVIPAAPDGALFFDNGDRVFPAFLDQILRAYKVQGGKLHVAGNSNGGLSAFHIAARYPKYFVSVTGFPGFLEGATAAQVAALKPLCIYMHVGDQDPSWLSEMRTQAQELRQMGFKIHFTVEKDEPHVIRGLGGAGAARLFNQFDEAARGCGD